MKEAVSYGDGIRILNQDLWEAVISFIISASNNIPRIKGIIERLCENFGKQISYMGKTYYTFPDTDTIYSLSKEDLSVIRSGFRDKYIMDAADKFKSGTLTEEYIKSLSTPDAKKALMTINGVGNKVSDCILLFGLGRVDSFPVDVWIKRIMEYCYFDGEQSIPAISAFAEKHFGDIGGFAQQYLFFYEKTKSALNNHFSAHIKSDFKTSISWAERKGFEFQSVSRFKKNSSIYMSFLFKYVVKITFNI